MSATNEKAAEPSVRLLLTRAVEADFRRAAMFPGLRLDLAQKTSGAYAVFIIPVSFAVTVTDFAGERMRDPELAAGLKHAYRSLRDNLQRAIDEAEGVAPMVEREEWASRVASVGCLPVGSRVCNDLGEVVVVRPYGVHMVGEEDGAYRSEDGKRFSYRYGYCVSKDGGELAFASAGDLCDLLGRPTHLRLVRVNGASVGGCE